MREPQLGSNAAVNSPYDLQGAQGYPPIPNIARRTRCNFPRTLFASITFAHRAFVDIYRPRSDLRGLIIPNGGDLPSNFFFQDFEFGR